MAALWDSAGVEHLCPRRQFHWTALAEWLVRGQTAAKPLQGRARLGLGHHLLLFSRFWRYLPAGGSCWLEAFPPPAPPKLGISGLCEWPCLGRCCRSTHLLGRLSGGREEEEDRQKGEEEEEEEGNKCFL